MALLVVGVYQIIPMELDTCRVGELPELLIFLLLGVQWALQFNELVQY